MDRRHYRDLEFPCSRCDALLLEDTEFQCDCGDYFCGRCAPSHECKAMATEPCEVGNHRAPLGSVLPLPCDCDVIDMCQVCQGAHDCDEYRAAETKRVETLRRRWKEARDMYLHEMAERLVG